MSEPKKYREFIAFKRAKSSSWNYDEYSERVDSAIDKIAPDSGYFCKLRLIDKSALHEANEMLEKMAAALVMYQTIGEAGCLPYDKQRAIGKEALKEYEDWKKR